MYLASFGWLTGAADLDDPKRDICFPMEIRSVGMAANNLGAMFIHTYVPLHDVHAK